ncbi:MAG: histidine--tRNA ligase [bacterium]|nr:histidine--tRNA ligase [bacterium]
MSQKNIAASQKASQTKGKNKSAKDKRVHSVKGMRDFLENDQLLLEKIFDTFKELTRFYNYRLISTPIVEPLELFERSNGEQSDIVQKEMYQVKARGSSKKLGLRPEFTPSAVRAYIENGLTHQPHPVKLALYGPLFRHDKPQLGRYRQFHQADLEIFSTKNNPLYDAQIILASYRLFEAFKINDVIIQINSIGCKACRPNYVKQLAEYYKKNKKSACEDCKDRLPKNTLRLLDCKKEKCQELKSSVPMSLEHLCVECKTHFKSVLEFLEELGLPYNLNHTLVRGLDYYSKTVFEFTLEKTDANEKFQNLSLGGGGRYDYLVEHFGARHTPAVGVALGVDRIMDLIKERKLSITVRPKDKIFLIHIGELAKRKSLPLIEELRKSKIQIREALGKESLAAQLKIADKLGVKIALIFGQKEAFEDSVIIRDMKTGAQETVPLAKIAKVLKKRL